VGLDVERGVASTNESYEWAEIPKGVSSESPSLYGDVLGLSGVEGGQPILFTPYLVAGSSSSEGAETHQGFDLKAALGASGSAQLSFRTDFAQVSPDDAFVNLGRF